MTLNPNYNGLFEVDGKPLRPGVDCLEAQGVRIPVVDGIPRFVPTSGYARNFSMLRERHARLQLDSVNGTTDRRDTLLSRTNWPAGFFAGKTVLECGSGAGPDTEILLSLGARVVSVDLAGVDVARRNVGDHPNSAFVQASIVDLPFRKGSFDIVYCHRVLQHTPDPQRTLDHILQFVKPQGAAFVHSYARTLFQMCRWKYALLPLTRRMDPERLYRLIRSYAPAAYSLTRMTSRVWAGQMFNWFFVPFLNYIHHPIYAGKSREFMIEYAIHETFDALSPTYDTPLSGATMRSIAALHLERPFEVFEGATVTLLRTQLMAHERAI